MAVLILLLPIAVLAFVVAIGLFTLSAWLKALLCAHVVIKAPHSTK
ncbi:MAG TPA: hypothetical protein VGJ21_06885 [Terracidiphilus sp.]|jgi:hypothetical protein